MLTRMENEPRMLVPLRESTVRRLMAVGAEDPQTLDQTILDLLTDNETPEAGDDPRPLPEAPSPKYRATVLGEEVTGNSLGEIFGRIVDCIHALDSECIRRLSRGRVSRRRIVSDRPDGVHISKPHLPVHQTEAGWFVSATSARIRCGARSRNCVRPPA